MRALILLRLMRPHQWIKNAFVLVGFLFGHAAAGPGFAALAGLALAAFCLASSAVYAFNDACDARRDRLHPEKRHRPVASGALARADAVAIAGVLAVAALFVAASAGWQLAAFVAAYLAMNAAYSTGLKRVPVLDVGIIAAGFMLRILAGTTGIGIPPSGWMLACAGCLTLFLGFAKRRAELTQLDAVAVQHREVLGVYGTGFLDSVMTLCAAATVVLYAMYTIAEDTAVIHGTVSLVLTLPFVLAGTLRILDGAREGLGSDPSLRLLRDPVLAGSAAGWVATVLLVLA